MSDGFLGDSVDTTLAMQAIQLYNICGVQWIARSVNDWRAVSLR